jgi:hypothetical protein
MRLSSLRLLNPICFAILKMGTEFSQQLIYHLFLAKLYGLELEMLLQMLIY